jgi:hypothetical protein
MPARVLERRCWTICFAAIWGLALAVGSTHAQTGAETTVGYLDNAVPQNMLRLRYDAGFDMNRPDRAAYFYATWAELKYHPHGVQNGGVFFDSQARGPVELPARVDYQEPSAYLEYTPIDRFSGFLDVPYRFINLRDLQEDYPESERKPAGAVGLAPRPGSPFFPEPASKGQEGVPNHTASDGFSDIQFGFKYAVIANPSRYLTFQLRMYCPSGSAGKGLGTGHWSVEPSVLAYQRLTDDLTIHGQITNWNPIGGAGAGPLLMYGVGLSYIVYDGEYVRITPVAEFVGWTVLYGFQSFFGDVNATPPPGLVVPVTHGVENAVGDTIFNGKIGVRTYFSNDSDLYIGYGRSLTGDRWYKDLLRVEYRVIF